MRIAITILFLAGMSVTLIVPCVWAGTPSPVKKLAVLPFDSPGDDPDRGYLGYSLAGEVITKLSYLNGVVVRPLSAVRKYGNRPKDLAQSEIAHQLDVEFILTGSCSLDGDTLMVESRLIRVTGNKELWNCSLAVPLAEISTLPGQILDRVVEGLSISPSAVERSRLRSDVSSNSTAYEYYLRAIAQKPVSADEWRACSRLLEKSVELYPGYAPAVASLGYTYLQYAGKVGGRGPFYQQARDTIERAFNINAESPKTLGYLSALYAKIGKSEDSAALMMDALKVYPDNPAFHARLGYVFRYAGLMEKSIAAYRRAQVLNGGLENLIGTQDQITKSMIYLGDYGNAVASHEKMKGYLEALGKTSNVKQLFYEGVIYLYLRDTKRAVVLFDESRDVDATSVWSAFGQAYRAAALGNFKRMLEITELLEARRVVDGERRYRLVHFYALAGRPEDAIRNLEISIRSGFFNYPYIISDPLLESLRDINEYQTLLAQASRRHDLFAERFSSEKQFL